MASPSPPQDIKPLTTYVADNIRAAWPAEAGPAPPAPSPELEAATMAYAFRHSAAVAPHELRRRLAVLQRAARAKHHDDQPEISDRTERAEEKNRERDRQSEAWAVAALQTIEAKISEYYAADWSHLVHFFRLNRPAYITMAMELADDDGNVTPRRGKHEGRRKRAKQQSTSGGAHDAETMSDVRAALRQTGRVLLLFGADFCKHCRGLAPFFSEAAEEAESRGEGSCLVVNGPHCLDLCESFGVSRFPTLLLLTGKENVDELDPHDKRRVLPFPRGVPRTTENILHFLRTGAPLQQGQGKEAAAAAGEGHGTCAMPPSNAISGRAQRCEASDAAKGSSRSSDSDDETDEGTTGVEALRSWRETLLRAGIDLVENLEDARRLRLAQLRRRIHPPSSSTKNRTLTPCIFFTGGGIASGKSGALKHLYASAFWEKYGKDVVEVAPDDIKSGDPLYRALQAAGVEQASVLVHSDSTTAAEQLLLDAVNHRRDILFDSTMQWAPFIRQTVEMVRDDQNLYRKGPGYKKHEDGTITERYWEISHPRNGHVEAYRLILLGVTLDAPTAVRRGVERWIVTGRSPSPINIILQSHQLFSKYFEEYAQIFDDVYLFDRAPPAAMSDEMVRRSLEDDAGERDEGRGASPSQGACDAGEAAQGATDGDAAGTLDDDACVTDELVVLTEEDCHSQIIAAKVNGRELQIRSPSKYAEFLYKQHINIKAACAAELYPPTT